jgi:hypothetical protein
MSNPPFPSTDVFTGGQMTDLPSFTGTSFDGTELFEVVAPGNAAEGVNYSISSALLALLLGGLIQGQAVVVRDGATSGDPYDVPTDVSQVLFKKTVGAASYALLAASASYPGPVAINDLKGDAAINPITINFTGGELCDGNASIVLNANYALTKLFPNPDGGWYIGA